jgi:hypothetical protein
MKSKIPDTQRDLTDALQTLRLLVREVGGCYVARLQSDIAHVQQIIRTMEKIDSKHHRQMTNLLKTVTDLDIKPQKGRRRDLKELDRLITKLSDTADNW